MMLFLNCCYRALLPAKIFCSRGVMKKVKIVPWSCLALIRPIESRSKRMS